MWQQHTGLFTVFLCGTYFFSYTISLWSLYTYYHVSLTKPTVSFTLWTSSTVTHESHTRPHTMQQELNVTQAVPLQDNCHSLIWHVTPVLFRHLLREKSDRWVLEDRGQIWHRQTVKWASMMTERSRPEPTDRYGSYSGKTQHKTHEI